MAIDRILRYFQPKDKTFFPLLERAADNIVEIAEVLSHVVREPDLLKREDLIRKVEELEHAGDEITHEVLSHLNTVFITPFDREDIHALITSIDDVADHVKDAALRIRLFKPVSLTPPIAKLSELICHGTVEVRKAVMELKNVRNLGKLKKLIIDINNVENQADAIFELAMTDLFENEKDPIEIIKIKDIIAKMESATDRCEDIANVIESIIVKTT